MSSAASRVSSLISLPLVRPLVRWLDAMPHPALACEIAATHIAAGAGHGGQLTSSAVETLPGGAVVPSPVELNIADAGAVRERLQRALSRIHVHTTDVALLVPDQVVRVFLLHFDTFPRGAAEAVPLLRWRLKKSVPFDVEDTVVSYRVQPGTAAAPAGVNILAAVARRRVLRQYEELLEAAGLAPGLVLSSTLATLPFLDDPRPILLARLSDSTLTTVIARGELLCVYRCTEMPSDATRLEPQSLLEEIYPAVAFYQDTWRENVAQVRLAGLGARADEFRRAIETELGLGVAPLAGGSGAGPRAASVGRELADRHLEALAGYMLNQGA